ANSIGCGRGETHRRGYRGVSGRLPAAGRAQLRPDRPRQGYGDLLRRKCGASLNEQGQEYVARMHDAAARMRTLITDLLAFSRLTTQAQCFVRVDLSLVAREVVSDLENRIAETGGRVEVGDLPSVDADPTQMRQLFLNLIGNGLKFHRPGELP